MKRMRIQISRLRRIAGLLLFVAGTAYGAAGEEGTSMKKRTEAFENIHLDLVNQNVELEISDENIFGFEISTKYMGGISWKLKDSTLFIGEKTFSADRIRRISELKDRKKISMRIYIPANVKLGKVFIRNTAGHTGITGISCGSMELKFSSGYMSLISCSADAFSSKCTSGGLSIDVCKFKRGQAGASSGKLEATATNLRDFGMKTTSGNISFSGTMAGECALKSSSGNISCKVAGSVRNFAVSADVTSGKILINDRKQDTRHYLANENCDDSISIRTTSGNVQLNFAADK